MKRRGFLRTLLCLPGLQAVPALAREPGGQAFSKRYAQFAQRYVGADGAVRDSGNAGISHTEGQGVGLLFAAEAGDRAGFDRLWAFTQKLRREDGLFSWKYEGGRVADPNNASDGDIYIAWGLLHGAKRFGSPRHRDAARAILRAIRQKLLHQAPHGLVLLPGIQGFAEPGEPVVVNPSYWVFPALSLFAQEDPAPEWDALLRSGREILGYARFGKYQLPPDWLALSDPVVPWEKRPPRFGYDAIRVPLYLAWPGQPAHPAVDRFVAYAKAFPAGLPGSYDFSREAAADYRGGSGHDAVAAIALARAGAPRAALETLPFKDYYADSLVLLAMLAQRQGAA
ncbi:MAG: glycosyl hydrolase family 8 [Candidatus Dactylopiibacterium sp.]|nr:glycosyl hydrolase family 8 [Candidatus Dactylopiibacterium sp.]